MSGRLLRWLKAGVGRKVSSLSLVGWLAVATLQFALCPAGGHAQEHFLEVSPSVANGFFPSRVLRITTSDGTVLQSRVEDALAGSLVIGFRPLERLSLQFEGIHAFSTESSVFGAPSLPPLSIDVSTGYTIYGAAVRYSFPTPGQSIRPSVVVGVGKKEFDPALTGTASPLTVSAGAGLRLKLAGWPDVRTEVRDYVSSFDPGQLLPGLAKETFVQHDLFWKVSAVFGLF